MGAIVWLNKYDLVFVAKVQWLALVHLDGEMEHAGSDFHFGYKGSVVIIFLCDYVCATESKLRGAAPRDKDGAVVDRDRKYLFVGYSWKWKKGYNSFIPERRWCGCVAEKGRILVISIQLHLNLKLGGIHSHEMQVHSLSRHFCEIRSRLWKYYDNNLTSNRGR